MKTRLALWIAVVIELTTAGCRKAEVFVHLPAEGGRIQFQVWVPSGDHDLYNSWQFCYEGTLEAAQGNTPGADETFRTYQYVSDDEPFMTSPLSEELRAGTWRIRARLTGFAASGSQVLIDVADCTNLDGVPPAVYAYKTTLIHLNKGPTPQATTCVWEPIDGDTIVPNMDNVALERCSPDP
jgi:hypothetical protein